ncbi:hypothetical protein [Serratia silvae]|uniref:DUF4762 family protein n=1 Tax=Serratia silvae TaxID=2824122 RepID=A0ABT0KDG6_9GAMM|nr:hypothetical protein [Serratia silvae]MCL1030070.1 DUF4762 family protein [Serratia silvae]
MKKITHKKATNVIGGNDLVCGKTRYLWIRDDDGSGNYICMKREECNTPDNDKFGNSQIHFNRVASSFCGR